MPTPNNQLFARLGRAVSSLFGSPRECVIVVGFDARVRLLVTELGAIGKEVSLVKPATAAKAQCKAPPGVSVVHSNRLGAVALERAGAKAANCLVAATADNALNLDLCREARGRFGVPLVIARTKLVEGVTNWVRLNEAGMVRMTWADTVRVILGETAPNANFSRLASVSDQEQIVDLEMQSPVFVGRKIADLQLNDCEVLALTRDGNSVADSGSIELRMKDVLTLAGNKASLASVREALATL